MTNSEAAKGLEKLIKFYEDNQQHMLLGAARQLLDDANRADPEAEANLAISHFVEQLSSPEMMKKLSRTDEVKNEDSCDWTANGSNNNFYSMRDVPTAESTKSNFRTLCEEVINKYNEESAKQRLSQVVAAACNYTEEEAWNDILAARQNLEEEMATDPERAQEYIHWALEGLGLEMDYAEDFLTNVPYKPYQPDSNEDDLEMVNSMFS